MRMRKKPNLIPRMERCAHINVSEPESVRGRWLESFCGYGELYLELGCGKGRFTAEFAAQNPGALIIGLEKVPEALVVAMERVVEKDLKNVRFIEGDAVRLPEFFAPDEVSRILINFCDPWPKARGEKHRLTAPGFLTLYEQILKPEGELWFKTDNAQLFEWSLEKFAERGWSLVELTRNLHEHEITGVMTDYEEKFHGLGVPINRVVARCG